MSKTGVFIVNLGTPDSPSVGDVRKYLREFLMDKRVIDIPFIPRYLLVNGIIAPFRGPKSAKIYQKVWTPKGSPLKLYGLEIEKLLQNALGEDFTVKLGMRYKNPSIESVLNTSFKDSGIEKLIVLPMFPQYASATTGSVQEEVMRIIQQWQLIPSINFIDSYPINEDFIEAFATIGKEKMKEHDYEHFVFTYHGLPESQIQKGDATGTCLVLNNCCNTLHDKNRLCYRAQCFATTRALVKALEIPEGKYTVTFQSRLGNQKWIQPYTEDIVKELTQKGIKKVLAFVPSFVADCLETTVEVGEEYKELFEEHGGEHWEMVPSLNAHPLWVKALKNMVLANV